MSVFAFIPNKAASDARKILLDSPWECVGKGQPPAQISAAARVNFSSVSVALSSHPVLRCLPPETQSGLKPRLASAQGAAHD